MCGRTDMNVEYLTIGNKEFEVELKEIDQRTLKFYPENPRVYSVLNIAGEEPTQDEIEKLMCSQEHVKQLKESIVSNGGLIDPLIVRDGDYTVLEGNSRLAAYRILNHVDAIKWAKVKCKLLPADIEDDYIFQLLGQYHIIGRKDWEPFEQAHYLYRRLQQTRYPIEKMADSLGITEQKAKQMILVIEFMIKNNDLNKRRWSYYEEYLKNAALKKYRKENPDIDTTIAKAVKSGQIKEASDIRKLGEIAKVGDKQSKKLMQAVTTEKKTIYEAYEDMQEAGKLDDVVKKLKNFKEYVNNSSFEKQLETSPETLNNSLYEIRKIWKRLKKIDEKHTN